MKISVFTPTHDAAFLPDAYRSLLQQSHDDWEWIVVPNGTPQPAIPPAIASDPRVKVKPAVLSELQGSVGALKRYACGCAAGDVLVELDHDDMLVPGVLLAICKEVSAGAGFVYSDECVFWDDRGVMRSIGFSRALNFRTYPWRWRGTELRATECFDVTARSLCEVFYAPDHVRCWSTTTYREMGGHDPTLRVGDDHDLVCRTYLSGARFAHTGSVGYLYRYRWGASTIGRHHEEIVTQQTTNRNRYLDGLIAEWARRIGAPVCRLSDGHLGADGRLRNMAHDSASVAAVETGGVLSKVRADAVIDAVNDLFRQLVPGGWLRLRERATDRTPSFSGADPFCCSTAAVRFLERTELAMGIPTLRARFQVVRMEICGGEVIADLCALKGQRQPGPVLP